MKLWKEAKAENKLDDFFKECLDNYKKKLSGEDQGPENVASKEDEDLEAPKEEDDENGEEVEP